MNKYGDCNRCANKQDCCSVHCFLYLEEVRAHATRCDGTCYVPGCYLFRVPPQAARSNS